MGKSRELPREQKSWKNHRGVYRGEKLRKNSELRQGAVDKEPTGKKNRGQRKIEEKGRFLAEEKTESKE